MAERSRPEGGGFVPMSLLLVQRDSHKGIDPDRQAREMLAAAKKEAERTLAEAEARAAAIETEARTRGYQEGLQKGEAEGRERYLQRLRDLEPLVESLIRQRGEIGQRYAADLLQVIEAMVDQLVHHEVSANPRVIRACLEAALAFVSEQAMVRVRLHPDDFQRLKDAALADPDLFGGREQLDLVEDPGVSAGGCQLSSDFGDIDASIDAFRERLSAALRQSFLAALADDGSRDGEGGQ
ncbi:MAG: FliH/SctL family protein [Thermodesulfobacteriota bacterium]